MDYTRRFDIEELYLARKNARNAFERDLVDKTIEKIAREGNQVAQERQQLFKAIRANDRRSVRYYNERISKIIQDKSYGRNIS